MLPWAAPPPMQAAVTPGCAWRTAAGGAASYVADNGARLLPRHLRAILPIAKARGITQDLVVSLGASALALLACTEVVQARLDASDHMHVGACTQCVRGQQRSDGLFLHDDDRRTSPPLDRPSPMRASPRGPRPTPIRPRAIPPIAARPCRASSIAWARRGVCAATATLAAKRMGPAKGWPRSGRTPPTRRRSTVASGDRSITAPCRSGRGGSPGRRVMRRHPGELANLLRLPAVLLRIGSR